MDTRHYATAKREVTLSVPARRWSWTRTLPTMPSLPTSIATRSLRNDMAAIAGKGKASRTVRSLSRLGASPG